VRRHRSAAHRRARSPSTRRRRRRPSIAPRSLGRPQSRRPARAARRSAGEQRIHVTRRRPSRCRVLHRSRPAPPARAGGNTGVVVNAQFGKDVTHMLFNGALRHGRRGRSPGWSSPARASAGRPARAPTDARSRCAPPGRAAASPVRERRCPSLPRRPPHLVYPLGEAGDVAPYDVGDAAVGAGQQVDRGVAPAIVGEHHHADARKPALDVRRRDSRRWRPPAAGPPASRRRLGGSAGSC
jgi:hypothetical protein